MPSKNNLKDKARGTHTHGGKSRGLTKVRKARPDRAKDKQPVLDLPKSSAGAGSSAGPLESDMRVLLLSEGNFAFAAALALDWGECPKLMAITKLTEASTREVEDAEDNLETVKAFGGTVAFTVDPTALHASEHVMRAGRKAFDRVVVNFPHAAAGTPAHLQIESCQAMLRGIFKSVLSNRLLHLASGELHVTLHRTEAAKWRLVEIAKIAGLRVKSCGPLDVSRYHGYVTPPGDGAVTYVFVESAQKMNAEQQKALAVAAMAKARPELRLGPTGQTYKEAWKQRHRKGK